MHDKDWRQTDSRRTCGGSMPVRVIASGESIDAVLREFSVAKSPTAAVKNLAQADASGQKNA